MPGAVFLEDLLRKEDLLCRGWVQDLEVRVGQLYNIKLLLFLLIVYKPLSSLAVK